MEGEVDLSGGGDRAYLTVPDTWRGEVHYNDGQDEESGLTAPTNFGVNRIRSMEEHECTSIKKGILQGNT